MEWCCRYSDSQNWKSALVEWNAGEDGGYKEAVLEIQGDSVYSKLKYEAGACSALGLTVSISLLS